MTYGFEQVFNRTLLFPVYYVAILLTLVIKIMYLRDVKTDACFNHTAH